ncbi:bifunctional aminoglycoside phosphotransferase/ATP-binding protein [Acidihalobacter prosperus]|uniref:Aminoglycoside phosphotransferase domain-containing protein n=1 Tax=Acidihalobacter prosperus TaxID=160660 RepID=A0A1A6C7H8_9GAMM|nr:bifunctional aminoglycoside phosphotransferase/ATP-binding protein [Acidihalobacter prosperus]OBS10505.1 hypothetical protein Thpro_020221 [Acidihalobacter prosperus]
MDTSDFSKLLKGLQNPAAYPHQVSDIRVIETHISAVLLTGEYAYKLKKPLDMGFLDFSTLERRRHFCAEEIRLNRRLAPNLYLDTVAVTGNHSVPKVGGNGEAIEYMVRMRQFDPEQQLDRLLARGELSAAHIDSLIARIAAFHAQAATVDPASQLGTPEAVFAPMQQNFDQLHPLIDQPARRQQLRRLEDWTRAEYDRLAPLLAERRAAGHIRECHGDMHLGNMAVVDGDIAIFDGIEFNDDFRWIDVANEIAFFVMDLESRGAAALAHRALNAWVELSGDHQALRLMRFYQTYRAMVRAKVASIRLGQTGLADAEREEVLAAYQRYADLAEHYTTAARRALLITRGFAGAGKTTLSTEAVESLGMIRLRSDVERKRLHGLPAEARSGSGIGTGLYAEDATERTYDALQARAEAAIDGGFPVVVDASFLARRHRRRFAELAAARELGFAILDVQAPEDQLKERLQRRQGDASEATADILDWQTAHAEAVESDEPCLKVDGREPLPTAALRARLDL